MESSGRRSQEQLKRHFAVEREIAERIKQAPDAAGRRTIYLSMYDELFRQVPDHPRLTRRAHATQDSQHEAWQSRLLEGFLKKDCAYLEFGAGDCRFALNVAKFARRVCVVEIADQIPADVVRPANFELLLDVGDGFKVEENAFDVAFSNQFVEHLHPEDASRHFAMVHRMLKPGGTYVLATPERWTGPHDISGFFSDTAQGFRLHEWTYAELLAQAQTTGFSACRAMWFGKGIRFGLPWLGARALEDTIRRMPRGLRRKLGRFLVPMIVVVLRK